QDTNEITALFGQNYRIPAQPEADIQDRETMPEPGEIPESCSCRKKVVFINASPRAQDRTASASFIARAEKQFDDTLFEKEVIQVRKVLDHQRESAFEKIRTADAVVFVFPLYVYCLPGMLTRFLRDYAAFLEKTGQKQNSTAVYTIVNCGFPEPYINEEAEDVIKSFCRQTGMKFRSGILIGGGVMITAAEKAPPVQKLLKQLDEAFLAVTADILAPGTLQVKDVQVRINFPHGLFYFIGSLNWKAQAKHNGLKVRDMYRRPYGENATL
ncbi:MAG: NAD(P)H-dependent oxidoreductase, partial [Treponema sp.]|nr:NAD(P)H-dependent oxidoreductase [Treponema sp.]